jgi:hypothetical protein
MCLYRVYDLVTVHLVDVPVLWVARTLHEQTVQSNLRY